MKNDVTGAPQWLIDRMEAVKKLPPPTLEEVETSFRASERQRKEFDAEEARKDLIKRMQKLKDLPPPSIEKVRAQWKASAEFERKLVQENPYKNVDYIR